jgi:HEAT repeat protein
MKKFFCLFCILGILLTGCFGKPIEAECAKDLKSEDVETRIKAARKLSEVATPEAVRLLLLHEDDPDYRVKQAIKKSLAKIDKRTFLN